MFQRPESGEQAILVNITFPSSSKEEFAEFKILAHSAGAKIMGFVTATRQTPNAKYFIGSGKAEEIRDQVAATKAEIVIFNHSLLPAQERNLEKFVGCRVLDRTGLILDIFAQRARTFEGKLQVELAQLQYLSTRLVRGWSHLERQKGGIGLRGPGETQLETDRRLVRGKIKIIHRRLQKVQQQREQNRRARQRTALPTVALVGYTNAGKSALFEALTGEHVYIADQLFATLDPTLRRLELPGSGPVILADTVGFIRHLPHDLVAAFRATLEETREADLLLHVIDISDPNWRDTIEQVNTVLTEIGADQVPQLLVFNKIDLLPHHPQEIHAESLHDQPNKLWVSAITKEGLNSLQHAISTQLWGEPIQRNLRLLPQEGKLRAELYRLGAILHEEIDESNGDWLLTVRMTQKDFSNLFGNHTHSHLSDITPNSQ